MRCQRWLVRRNRRCRCVVRARVRRARLRGRGGSRSQVAGSMGRRCRSRRCGVSCTVAKGAGPQHWIACARCSQSMVHLPAELGHDLPASVSYAGRPVSLLLASAQSRSRDRQSRGRRGVGCLRKWGLRCSPVEEGAECRARLEPLLAINPLRRARRTRRRTPQACACAACAGSEGAPLAHCRFRSRGSRWKRACKRGSEHSLRSRERPQRGNQSPGREPWRHAPGGPS